MPIKRLTVLAALVTALFMSSPAAATTAHPAGSSFTAIAPVTSPAVSESPLAQLSAWTMQPGLATITSHVAAVAPQATATDTQTAGSDGARTVTDLRKALIGLAMELRDTRYVRGGRDPATGFDCSGFVRYVFAHAVGMQLPTTSASQFLAGLKVQRSDMKPGDLVFFKTGRKRRISHVGIYISNGRFIHSPTTGKNVQVSSLDESYWARHFAGAKRPSGIAAAVASNG